MTTQHTALLASVHERAEVQPANKLYMPFLLDVSLQLHLHVLHWGRLLLLLQLSLPAASY